MVCSNEAPSRARKLVSAGDVLVSTVRPNLNAVALVSKQYDSEIASTGFCILRPNTNLIEPGYLYYFVQSVRFIQHLTQRATGAGYPAVSDTDILETEIPLPPLDEQKRIAALLDKANRLHRSRRYVQELSESFLQSVFLEMFGDPVANPFRWNVVVLEDLGNLDRGRSRHRPRNAPQLLGGPYPLIQTGEVANSDGHIRTYKQTYSKIGLEQSKMWPKGTLCSILSKNRGGLGRRERHGGVGFSRALGDEGGQGGHLVGARQAVVQIVGDVDAELGRRLRDRAEDVPGRDARL